MTRLAVGLFVALGVVSASAGPAPLSIDVMPRLGIAPKTVRVWVRVERDARNRELHLSMEGDYEGRVSSLELDGESPVFYERQFEVSVGGCVEFAAVVRRQDGSEQRVSVKGSYVGRGMESEDAVCGS